MPILNKVRPAFHYQGKGRYELLTRLDWRDPKTEERYSVPAGFEWDLASIPKLVPRWVLEKGDYFIYPSCLHDYMYEHMFVSKREADRVMRTFLREEGLSWLQSWVAWSGVRINLPKRWKWGK